MLFHLGHAVCAEFASVMARMCNRDEHDASRKAADRKGRALHNRRMFSAEFAQKAIPTTGL
jgi:hypothetical protein